uniref:NADH-ubiquinone oxidoreductase chain 6 n=1 Tax=Pomponia linearis TaxID=1195093 RepID=A0A343KGP8_9HEMI|nr:NADH dehydrogenase subunit 6 [Pomponia linearis]
MKILMFIMILLSINFMFMKHPLSMGSMLLLQTIFSSLTCSLNLSSHFMSYILFLIFIGGMLVLFMYMSSIASNEKFMFSMKLLLMNSIMTLLLMMVNFENFNSKMFNTLINSNIEHYNNMLNKLYIMPSGIVTLMIIIYLLLTLIIVSNMIKMKNMPLRSN